MVLRSTQGTRLVFIGNHGRGRGGGHDQPAKSRNQAKTDSASGRQQMILFSLRSNASRNPVHTFPRTTPSITAIMFEASRRNDHRFRRHVLFSRAPGLTRRPPPKSPRGLTQSRASAGHHGITAETCSALTPVLDLESQNLIERHWESETDRSKPQRDVRLVVKGRCIGPPFR